ncbi:hypothetical protein [Candidatus Palauibacter sp.]|uniref:hypothetical protein n=1 Tax=Candidatus Palauibacter sp. TaxID=3101350 RepID=UPI003D0D7837
MRPTAVGVLATLSIAACRQAEPATVDTGSLSELTPDAVFADDSLGWIVEIALAGDRVVALDALLEPAVHVVDLERPGRLGSYGLEGDGPGEFKDPEQIVTGAGESPDEVWILDGIHQRLTRLSLPEIETGAEVSPETVPLNGPNAGALVRTSDGTWFAGGWITDGRIGRYHADRSYDRTILGFPPDVVDVPGTTLPQAYESWVVADPEGERLAAATLLGGLLEIFDHDGVPIARAAVPEPFRPAWAQGRSRNGRAVMAVSPETRYGFTDLAATRRYALIIATPLSAVSVPETETPTRAATFESGGATVVCTIFTDADGARVSNCTALANAIAAAIAAQCEEHGGELGHFDMVTCFYLGGGYYLVRVEASCVY